MIAGGTGITPMYQVIRACLRNPSDRSKITLIYANVNLEDILLKADLEELQNTYGLDRFKIYYVLNNPPQGWKGGVGFVTNEHIKEHIPNPGTTDSKLLLCGQPDSHSGYIRRLIHSFFRSSPNDCCNEVSGAFFSSSLQFLNLITRKNLELLGYPIPNTISKLQDKVHPQFHIFYLSHFIFIGLRLLAYLLL